MYLTALVLSFVIYKSKAVFRDNLPQIFLPEAPQILVVPIEYNLLSIIRERQEAEKEHLTREIEYLKARF